MIPQGFYVYELVDPRDGQVFYVGKGKSERAWNHEAAVRKGAGINQAKCARIRAILDVGETVRVSIVQAEMLEDDAYALEAKLIGAQRETLTNVNDGGECRKRIVRALDLKLKSPVRMLMEQQLRYLRAARECAEHRKPEEPIGELERQFFTAAIEYKNALNTLQGVDERWEVEEAA